MNNAKYHCTYPDYVPKGAKKKKIDFINYCQSRNIPINPTDTILMIKEKMKEKMKQEKMVCELLSEERGHKVLFTPPCLTAKSWTERAGKSDWIPRDSDPGNHCSN